MNGSDRILDVDERLYEENPRRRRPKIRNPGPRVLLTAIIVNRKIVVKVRTVVDM